MNWDFCLRRFGYDFMVSFTVFLLQIGIIICLFFISGVFFAGWWFLEFEIGYRDLSINGFLHDS